MFKKIKLTNSQLAHMYAHMMERCYDQNYLNRKPSYQGCSICEEWYNPDFAGKRLTQEKNPYRASFYEWCRQNFYCIDIKGQPTVNLDKDIKVKGNKVYSPETCLFVPKSVNNFFSGLSKKDGLPPKISIDSKTGKFTVKDIKDVLFDTKEDAWSVAYSLLIQQRNDLADRYYRHIPRQVYDAIMTYDWDITD